MHKRKSTFILVFILLLTLILSACGDNIPTSISVTATTTSEIVKTTTNPPTPNPTPKPTTIITTVQTTTAAATEPVTAKPTATPQTTTGKIALYSLPPESKREVVVINPDGSGKTTVAEGSSGLFSPDGKRIAYLSPTGATADHGWGAVPQVGIYSSNLDGSDKKLHCSIDGNAVLSLVRWSPRNRYIAVNGTQSGPGQVFLCNLTDGVINELFRNDQGANLILDWTADGENMLWQSGTDYTDLNLYYGDPDKGFKQATALTTGQYRSTKFPQLLYYTAARFSPDGKTIAIAGDKIFFISAPGQKSPLEGKVISSIKDPGTLAWSPDGRALVINDGTHTVKIIDIASGKVTQLADNMQVGDWSP